MKNVKAAIQEQADGLDREWAADPRWRHVRREHTAEQVVQLRGSRLWQHPIARHGAERLWGLVNGVEGDPYINTLGALTGNQAVQMVRAGLKSIYLSGWQVAADANLAETMYPDQSLYPVNSVPSVIRRINNALQRADQIEWAEGKLSRNWFAPIVADAEAGFGGPLNAYELMRSMIQAGAAGVHFEDQLASEKKCGHMGGKVLIPTSHAVRQLKAARLAADVVGVPTVLIGRTDARAATLITSDIDPADRPRLTGERTAEGFYRIKPGLDTAIDRAIAYAPYADLLWCETSKPDLEEAKRFASAVRDKHPGKLLAYNCSPSFNWKKHLTDEEIAEFQVKLGEMGYKFQFITLAGFHALNHAMYELASGYRARGMAAYVDLQEAEFAAEEKGYTATKHQREVGAGYFDEIYTAVSGGDVSTLAMEGSTETEQFQPRIAARYGGSDGNTKERRGKKS